MNLLSTPNPLPRGLGRQRKPERTAFDAMEPKLADHAQDDPQPRVTCPGQAEQVHDNQCYAGPSGQPMLEITPCPSMAW